MIKAVISGTGLYTPPATIDNDELVEAFNQYVELYNAENADAIAAGDLAPLQPSSSAFIEKASGIKRRHVIDKTGILDPKRMAPLIPERSNEEPSVQCEMAVSACKEALEQAGKTVADVDALIVACSNMQRPYPAISIEVQEALGIDGFAYDMNVACSSATFGLQAAVNSVENGSARAVLVVSPEICSGHLNFRDRDSHFIFGDACTAILVEREENTRAGEGFEILGTSLKTKFSNNIRNNFGFLNRGDESGIGKPDKLFIQQGRKVFKEVSPLVAEMIQAQLRSLSLTPDDLKRMWLHQANLNMNQLIARKVLGRDASEEEAPVILDEYANTSSAGSIIAFHKHKEDLVAGDLGVICSFGAGYSVGSVVLRRR
ncbi:MAG: beta-ketoacyl-ACP synthase III [Gammaproteobacteria bacterium]|uniref:3-oxoacyl-[acyl-carrier-protein] synthase, KASIII n=1 Tax=Marinobacter nitratireducens TaxID=1137280 RepID=A0A072NGN0_9GAMM|nr:beta-ketoacyl-ACP synthase III [Marinobacter nitratireducens]KEF32275.1 3-oxoacyl-[acyl-carrier-protein] synthase, KASIII [Marinobacter nitratireducens]TNE72816.1 MAG: beta-ketoacyl-ACP synthase III [Gammaproteobacteria bacterium]